MDDDTKPSPPRPRQLLALDTLEAGTEPSPGVEAGDARADDDAEAPRPGARMGSDTRFELLSQIDRGGFGWVYRGRDTKLDRPVAIKVQRRPGKVSIAEEARILARSSHPNLLQVFDFGELDSGQPYLVTEFLEGDNLRRYLAEHAPLPPEEAVALTLQVLRGLVHAHGREPRPVIHRDLKPANVLRLPDGTVKIIDFGLAAEGLFGAVGTPPYMSPEQWRGRGARASMDLWAAALMLREMLTGGLPWSSSELAELGEEICREAPVPSLAEARPDLPAPLTAFVDRALAKSERARFGSAQEMLAALEQVRPALGRGGAASPYRYLEAFGTADAGFFFGRDDEVKRLEALLEERPLVAVLGASGAGKSSLTLAGLVPRLLDADPPWTALTMVPGREPLERLRECVPEAEDVRDVPTLLRQRAAAGERIVLVVDQLEEALAEGRGGPDPTTRAEFLDALANIASSESAALRVVVTLRHDRLDRLTGHRALAALVERGAFLPRPPDLAALAEALRAPAEAMHKRVEPELATRVAEAVVDERAPLPLLQFTASLLWERCADEDALTLSALEALGGVAGVIARHADDVVESLTAAPRRALARRLMLSLVDAEGQRRRRGRDALLERFEDPTAAAEVLDRLCEGRLLTLAMEGGEVTVEIAHESLVGAWPKLRTWIAEDGENERLRERLGDAADEWRVHDESDDYLWSEGQLARLTDLEPGRLSGVQRRFVQASRAFVDHRRRRRGWLLTAIVASLALVAAGAVTGMLEYRSQERLAQEERQRAQAGGLAASALTLLEESPRDALQTAVLAAQMDPFQPATRRALREALTGYRELDAEVVAEQRSAAVRVAAAGQRIVSMVDGAREAVLWRVEADQLVRERTLALSFEGQRIALSADGRVLVVGGAGGRVAAVDLQAAAHATLLPTHASKTTHAVAVGPQGRIVASAGADGVRGFDLRAGLPLWEQPRLPEAGVFDALMVAADGGTIDALTSKGELHELHTRPRIAFTLGEPAPQPPPRSLAQRAGALLRMTRDRLVSGHHRGILRVWRKGALEEVISPHQGSVTGLARGNYERTVFSAAEDGRLAMVTLPWTGVMTTLPVARTRAPIYGLAALEGGARLATGGGDGTLRLWAPQRGDLGTFHGAARWTPTVTGVSSRGDEVLVAQGRQLVLWRWADGSRRALPEGTDDAVFGASDRLWLVTGGRLHLEGEPGNVDPRPGRPDRPIVDRSGRLTSTRRVIDDEGRPGPPSSVWLDAEGRPLSEPFAGAVMQVDAAGERALLTRGDDLVVRELATGREWPLGLESLGGVSGQLAPNGELVLLHHNATRSLEVRSLDGARRVEIPTPRGVNRNWTMAWHPQSLTVVSAAHEGRLSVHTLDGERVVDTQLESPPFALAYAPDGLTLAVACRDGRTRLFDGGIPLGVVDGSGRPRFAGQVLVTSTREAAMVWAADHPTQLRVARERLELSRP